MAIDMSINLGHVLTALMIGGGLAVTFITMKAHLGTLVMNMASITIDLKELEKALVTVAVQAERLNAADERMLMQGKRIDELRSSIERIAAARTDEMTDRFNRLMMVLEK